MLRLLREPWRRIALEAARERQAAGLGDESIDGRVPAALILVALVLVFEWYIGDRDFFERHFGPRCRGEHYELWSFVWWGGSKLLGYGLVPLWVVRAFRLPASVLHVATAGFTSHLRAYLALYLAILPIVIAASRAAAFRDTYPFYRHADRSLNDFVAWELLYAASFVATELFYRGFVLGMLRRSLGPYAIFVMIVPYCTIHFGKPASECVGSIAAGIALGTLAMTTRSIWGGVVIHIAVAWTMDLLALSLRPG